MNISCRSDEKRGTSYGKRVSCKQVVSCEISLHVAENENHASFSVRKISVPEFTQTHTDSETHTQHPHRSTGTHTALDSYCQYANPASFFSPLRQHELSVRIGRQTPASFGRVSSTACVPSITLSNMGTSLNPKK